MKHVFKTVSRLLLCPLLLVVGLHANAQIQWIDLGLSVKWASCNLGAKKPWKHGSPYAWGETKSKKEYSKETSRWYGAEYEELENQGVIDSSKNLTSKYDVAQELGTGRMPTFAEIKELKEKCQWTWTTLNGVNGYNVVGPNGNSIFLPAAGGRDGSNSTDVGSSGYYWSSTAYHIGGDTYFLYFNSSECRIDADYRIYGFSIRPVMDK